MIDGVEKNLGEVKAVLRPSNAQQLTRPNPGDGQERRIPLEEMIERRALLWINLCHPRGSEHRE